MTGAQENIARRAKTLRGIAEELGVDWKKRASTLPSNDQLAMLGLLADSLGVSIAVALDEEASKADLLKHINANKGG
jgi:hypothetical protein